MANNNSSMHNSSGNDNSIPLIKEELNVDKKNVVTGKVVLKKEVIDKDINYDIDLESEKVNVERFPKNIEIEKYPDVRKEGNKTIIPVVKEVYVKKLILVEEVHLEKMVEQRTETITDTIREEKVNVHKELQNSK